MLTCDLDGIVKTAASRTEDPVTHPVHLPAKAAPTAGLGTMDWAAVLLTSQPITPLPPSAVMAGAGPTTPFAATLPRLILTPPTHPLRLINPESLRVTTTIKNPVGTTGTNAFPTESASTGLAPSPLVPKVSLLALFPVLSVVTTSALIRLSTSTTVVVAPLSMRVRTVTPSLAFGTSDASKALAKVSSFLTYP